MKLCIFDESEAEEVMSFLWGSWRPWWHRATLGWLKPRSFVGFDAESAQSTLYICEGAFHLALLSDEGASPLRRFLIQNVRMLVGHEFWHAVTGANSHPPLSAWREWFSVKAAHGLRLSDAEMWSLRGMMWLRREAVAERWSRKAS